MFFEGRDFCHLGPKDACAVGSVIGEEVLLCGGRIHCAGLPTSSQEVIGQSAGPKIRHRSVKPISSLVDNVLEKTPVGR